MRVGDIMKCCAHTQPVTAPCLDCLNKRLEQAGQLWIVRGREDANEQIRTLTAELAKAKTAAHSAAIAEQKAVETIQGLEKWKADAIKILQKQGEDLKDANAGMLAQTSMRIMEKKSA